MKKFFKFLFCVLIIIAVCAGIGRLRAKHEAEPEPEVIRPVRTTQLASSTQNFSKNYFGTVQGAKRVDLSFRVSGPLNKILVDKGAAVKKGDLLAILDKRDFNTNLKQAQSAQAQAQAQYKDAQTNFKRYENLYKQRAISKAQYDAAQTQVDVTHSAVNTAAARTAQARDALTDTELRAPFDGVIADRMAENFQDITAKQTIFSLQDISQLEIVFNIPDNDILLAPLPGNISLAQLTQPNFSKLFTLTSLFEAIPDKRFNLSLKEFAAQADPTTNTYQVTAVMPQQPDINLLPGMAAQVNVSFINNHHSSNFTVPASAILSLNNNYYLWRYASASRDIGEVQRVLINIIAPADGGMIEITGEDLKAGDVIVTAGVNFLRDNQKVRLGTEAN